jgi:O-acetyl-ADP-ribose deacetylase (regulator of RNase III)
VSVIEVIQGDITKLQVDVIVNAANSSLMGGGGVDGAIHRAAGPELLEECRQLKGCATGHSRITKGYRLPATYIIHTVGPVWYGGMKNEDGLLQSCYTTSLRLAVEHTCKTIGYPSISTGAYRFPFERAAEIAYRTIAKFIEEQPCFEKIYLVCFSENDRNRYLKVIQKIAHV